METIYTYPESLSDTNDDRLMVSSDTHPYPRSGHRVVATNEYLYVIGGYNPSLWDLSQDEAADTYYPLLKELWRFNLLTREWCRLQTQDMPVELASHAACLFSDRYLMVVGGTGVPFGHSSSNSVHVCDLYTLKWHKIEVINPTLLNKQYGHAMTIDGSCLYVVGGTTGYVYNMDVYELELSPAPSEENVNSIPSWTKLYDSTRSAAVEYRYRHEIVFYNRQIYVFGGGTSDSVCPIDKLDAFDVDQRQWVRYHTKPCCVNHGFPKPRRCHGATRYGKYVFIMGGWTNDENSDNDPLIHAMSVVLNDLWRFDLESAKWTKMVNFTMPESAFFHDIAVTPNGTCYSCGGVVSSDNQRRTSSVYRFQADPPTLFNLAAEVVAKHAVSTKIKRLCWTDLVGIYAIPTNVAKWLKSITTTEADLENTSNVQRLFKKCARI